MKTTVSLYDFRDAFHKMGRGEQFTYEGLEVIFDYLEACDEEMELDVIAICCDYSEDTPENIASYYDIDISEAEGDADEVCEIVRSYLEHHSVVLGETNSTIVFAEL
jgi:hypothetical protein